jgi:hypothetical protein
MAEILGIACSETGFRDEAELNDMRKKQNWRRWWFGELVIETNFTLCHQGDQSDEEMSSVQFSQKIDWRYNEQHYLRYVNNCKMDIRKLIQIMNTIVATIIATTSTRVMPLCALYFFY